MRIIMKRKINQTPKTINGKFMRYSPKYNVWVNREGSYAYREYNDSKLNGPLKIHQRSDGSKFLNTKSPGIIELDQLVADTIAHRRRGRHGDTAPAPELGKQRRVEHLHDLTSRCGRNGLHRNDRRGPARPCRRRGHG